MSSNSGHVALIRLSWPPKAISSNSRAHWAVKSAAIARYRQEAEIRAREQSVKLIGTASPRLTFAFHPPDRRRRDLHNMPTAMKAAIDGIADALGVDDHGFQPPEYPREFGPVVKGGCVLVEIRK